MTRKQKGVRLVIKGREGKLKHHTEITLRYSDLNH